MTAKTSAGPNWPELQGKLRQDGRKEGKYDNAEKSPRAMGKERKHEGLAGLSSLGHGIAVEGGRHRPGFSRYVKEY